MTLFLAAGLSIAGAQSGTTPAAPASTAKPATIIPPGPVAGAAVEVSGSVGGRLIKCPAALKLTREAVCLLAAGSMDALKPKVEAKLGDRIVEDWKTTPGSKSAGLVFKTGESLTFLLMAQASAKDVLLIVDAPKTTAQGGSTGAVSATQPAATPTTSATSSALESAFVSTADLKSLLTVSATGTTVTLTRFGQTLIVTAGSQTARLNNQSVTLANSVYAAGGVVFVPATALRQLGCVVRAGQQANQVSVTCGSKTQAVAIARR